MNKLVYFVLLVTGMVTAQQAIELQYYDAGILDGEDGGQGILVADVNNDGILDIFTAGTMGHLPEDPKVNRLYFGNDDGTFELYATNLLPTDWRFSAIKFADYDNDGNQDLLVAYKEFGVTNPTRYLSFWMGDGTGDFTEWVTFSAHQDISDFVVSPSLNNEEGMYIFAANMGGYVGSKSYIYFIEESGGFVSVELPQMTNVLGFAVLDYDLDGLDDVIINRFYEGIDEILASGIFLYKNMGNFTFTLVEDTPFPVTNTTGGPNWAKFAVGNIDNNPDGYLSIAIAAGSSGSPNFGWAEPYFEVYHNDGGVFSLYQSYDEGTLDLYDDTPAFLGTLGSGRIAFADLNNDGYDELFTARTGSVLVNNDGVLAYSHAVNTYQALGSDWPSYGCACGLEIGDLNNDGRDDIVLAGTNELGWGKIITFLNTTGLSIGDIPMPEVRVYPNPTNGYLYIESAFTVDTVQIVDMQGRAVAMPLYQNRLDMNGFSSGVYVLQYQIDGKVYHHKIVKK